MTENKEDQLTGSEELAVEIAAIQPRLYGFLLKRLADREQTLEVLQRTNLVICRKAAEFQRGSSFTAWAFTIAKFQVMAWRKSEGSKRLVFTDKVYQLLDRQAAEEAIGVDERIPVLRRCLENSAENDRDLGFCVALACQWDFALSACISITRACQRSIIGSQNRFLRQQSFELTNLKLLTGNTRASPCHTYHLYHTLEIRDRLQ